MLPETLDGAELIRIASAYFEPGGWQLIEMVLRGREIRLLPGRPQEGSNRIQTLLDEFMDGLARTDPPVRRKSMQAMLSGLSPDDMEAWYGRAVESWCSANGLQTSEVRIISSVILWPAG